jgi:hypothetical protein
LLGKENTRTQETFGKQSEKSGLGIINKYKCVFYHLEKFCSYFLAGIEHGHLVSLNKPGHAKEILLRLRLRNIQFFIFLFRVSIKIFVFLE